jgi:hypothetical protein
MAEWPVPNVVEKSCEPGAIDVESSRGGNVLIGIFPEYLMVVGIADQRPDHAIRGLHDAKGVLQSCVFSAWIDVVRHAELPNSA